MAVFPYGDARAFIRRFRDDLETKPFAVFALGPIHGDVKDWEDARRHLDQALWGLHPDAVGLFGGAIVPSTLHFPFSHLPAGDLRDWGEIEAWARRLPETLGLGVPV